MKNIWHYINKDNSNFIGSQIHDIDGYDDEICIICGGTEGPYAIYSSNDQGKNWSLIYQSGAVSLKSLAFNQLSGSFLFSSDAPIGLGVITKDTYAPFYITKEKDGIASNIIEEIFIDKTNITYNEIGEVYLLPGVTDSQKNPISKYNVNNNTWSIIDNKKWDNLEYHRKIRKFNGVTYVLSKGMISKSTDDQNWEFITSLDIRSKEWQPGNTPLEFFDIFVSPITNNIYLMCDDTSGSSHVLKSIDNGKTWDVLFLSTDASFNVIEMKGSSLYFYSSDALRVYNENDFSVRLFNRLNGLKYEETEDQDKFFINNEYVYLPTSIGVAQAKLTDIESTTPLYRYVDKKDHLAGNNVLSIAHGSDNNFVFVGTNNGLSGSQDEGKTWTTLDHLLSFNIEGEKVNDILCDRVGGTGDADGKASDIFCLATEQQGIITFSPSQEPLNSTYNAEFAASFTTKDGLASNQVSALLSVLDNGSPRYYCGHMGAGLSLPVESGKWRAVTRDNGLAGDYVLSVRKFTRKGEESLLICGYHIDGNGNQVVAISISHDEGMTWTAENSIYVNDVGNTVPVQVHDICYDTTRDTFYGFFMFGSGVNRHMILLDSTDGLKTWNAKPQDFEIGDVLHGKDFNSLDSYDNYKAKFLLHDDALYFTVPSIFYIFNLKDSTLVISSWQDGLRGDDSGVVSVDGAGQIYLGTRDKGLAISNVECIPFFRY